MLNRLSISNVALIEKLEIEFFNGFSVLTGETGAGKSIIIEALNFVLGERANRDLIQSGARKACVEATFHLGKNEPVWQVLNEADLATGDDELVLYREFSDSGKSVCRVNGTLVSAGQLKQLGDTLVDIHGQHEHQSLLNSKLHIHMLDGFGGEALFDLRKAISKAYAVASAAEKQLRAAEMDEHERERRCDLISYQLDEIDKAALQETEEEELLEKRRMLQNAQSIMESLAASTEELCGENGVVSILSQALRHMNAIADFQSDFTDLRDKLQEAYYNIEDAAFDARNKRDEFSYEPDMLNQVEWRLDTIAAMKRKYGDTIAEILSYRDKISQEYELLLSSEERRGALLRSYEDARDTYLLLAGSLSEMRKASADILRERLLPELVYLGMPDAVFEVHFDRLAGEIPSPFGTDTVEFMLSTNRGEPLKPLSSVASGGEISRIMLAFKAVLADIDGIPTMVFDEIDSGISGVIGSAVAEKMKEIASMHQVLCITHLPQIAAHASKQYLVYKETMGERTLSGARLLDTGERIREIARIMGSDSNDEIALAHARSLLEASVATRDM